jgi:serine/threonine protein phosphatase 1
MFDFAPRRRRGPAGARGCRAYAVGDVHGRLDLLEQLLAKIHADLARRPARKVLLVFVGDLIDRGPNSAQVIERLRTYRHPRVQPMFLLGNHEEVLLRIINGEAELIEKWRWFGGTECMVSYGVEADTLKRAELDDALSIVRAAVPDNHVKFIESFHDSCRFGDYLFVHAGIRPGVEFDQQRQSDLRWIREPFLYDETDHGFIVVHGHTISSEPELLPNRIGIDTGAYRSGVLTALAIDGCDTWLLDTRSAENQALAC